MITIETQHRILELHADGMTCKAIAHEVGCSKSAVWKIINRGFAVEPKGKANRFYQAERYMPTPEEIAVEKAAIRKANGSPAVVDLT